jgi:hypothetical protein
MVTSTAEAALAVAKKASPSRTIKSRIEPARVLFEILLSVRAGAMVGAGGLDANSGAIHGAKRSLFHLVIIIVCADLSYVGRDM